MNVSLRANFSSAGRHLPGRRLAILYKQSARPCTTACGRAQACESPKLSPSTRTLTQRDRTYHQSATKKAIYTSSSGDLTDSDSPLNTKVTLPVNGRCHEFSAVFLRDLCECPACVHEHTKQKLYSTTDIPASIKARSATLSQDIPDAIEICWIDDVPGFKTDHTTTIMHKSLESIVGKGKTTASVHKEPSPPILWDASSGGIADFGYQAYMNDDASLLAAIEQLQTHGLVFVTGVPGVEESVASIAERIGPVKDTFYGRTWDVRTVPKAINAAYTSGDLGFHTDLLYFDNPPHVQLLHCIQSSSSGGASVFADAFKCALDLYNTDVDAFNALATLPVNYHYKHPESNLYSTTKPVFDLRPLRIGGTTYNTLSEYLVAHDRHRRMLRQTLDLEIPPLSVVDCLEKINWGPPFMAPFSLAEDTLQKGISSVREALNDKVDVWFASARKFSALLERTTVLHERLMKPGECVLFNNTRVLHSRRAFNSDDVGKARWLRGTYVDKDPFFSKLKVLTYKAEQLSSSPGARS